jgi:hypothetical protein
MKTNITYENFAELLVKNVPELKKYYDEHLKDNEEIIQHVFLGEIFFYISKNINSEEEIPNYIIKLIKFLDDASKSSNRRIDNLICVSFLEYLMFPSNKDIFLIKLRSLLTPKLTEELKKMEDWKPLGRMKKYEK